MIGGIESIMKELSEFLAKDGWKIDVLVCHAKTGVPTDNEEIEYVHIHRSRTLAILFRLPLSLDFFFSFYAQAQISDIILIHHPFPLGFLAYYLFGRKKPLVIFYHSDIVKQKMIARILNPLIQWVLARTNIIFVTSRRLQENSISLRLHQQTCTITPLWIHTASFQKTEAVQKAAEKIRTAYKEPLLLAVGRLVYYKGFDILIRAVKNTHAQVLIIGEGPEKFALEKQIKENGLENRVKIIPPVSNLLPYYFAADIFVLPSNFISEAFGIVQLEAMACGLPVINTNLPTGVPEVSIHNETGITVPTNDVKALTSAIQVLLSNNSLRKQFGENAKKRSLLFESTKILQNISDQLKNLIQSNP